MKKKKCKNKIKPKMETLFVYLYNPLMEENILFY